MRYLRVISSLLIGHLALCNICVSQDKIDSLKKILRGLRDTARIDCLYELGVQYLCAPHKDSILYYTNSVYEESNRLNYVHGIAAAYMLRANVANRFYNDYSQMERLSREAINWFDRTANKKDIDDAYWELARALTNESNYEDALKNLKIADELAQKEGYKGVKGLVLETMTDIYRDQGEYAKLLETQQKVIQMDRADGNNGYYSFHELWVLGLMYRLLDEYAIALPFWRKLFVESEGGFGWSWNQMEYAELMTLANQPDSALYYYNKFDSAEADVKDLRFFLVSKGEYYLYLNQYATALPYFLKGLTYHHQLNDLRQVNRTSLDIAKTYAALQMNDSAICYAREGLAMALRTKAKPLIRDGYQILYAVYDRLKQEDSAYHYYRNYILQKEAVMNDQTRGKLAAYNYEHKIAMLDKEKVLQRQQLQKERNNRNMLIAALIIGLVLAAFLIRNVRLKRRKDQLQHLMAEANTQLENRRKEQQLAEIQQQKTELEMQALRAQMNPHFIFNSLNSINMFILENNKLRASEYLSKFSRLVRLILQNSQEALIPLERELEALQLYLELESLRFDNKFEHKIVVNNDLDPTVLKVPPLIIQPYVENAIWHGLMHKKEKGHLEIELSRQKEILVCKIIDDGVGRLTAEELKTQSRSQHKSLGIKITESRIAMTQTIGDTQSVEIRDLVYAAGSAAGTEVVLKIPVNIS